MNGFRSPLKVACVGAGYFSRFHYSAWHRLEDVSLVVSVDRNLDAARKRCARAYDDFSVMLKRESPDIVDIVTPPDTHLGLIRQSIAAKVPLVICQKPFCGGLESAQQAAALAEAHGSLVVVHENFRFQPWYRVIRTALDQGRVGALQQVSFRLRPGDGQGRNAYLSRQPYFRSMPRFLVHETGVHWIDTFRFLCRGEPESVYADLRRLNPGIAGEDAGYFLLAFENGVRALFDGNRLIDHPADNMRTTMGEALVEGTDGTIRLDGNGRVTFRKHGSKETETLLLPDTGAEFGGDCVYRLQQHVVRSVLSGDEPENVAREYLANLEIEEMIYRSAATGRRIGLSQDRDRENGMETAPNRL